MEDYCGLRREDRSPRAREEELGELRNPGFVRGSLEWVDASKVSPLGERHPQAPRLHQPSLLLFCATASLLYTQLWHNTLYDQLYIRSLVYCLIRLFRAQSNNCTLPATCRRNESVYTPYTPLITRQCQAGLFLLCLRHKSPPTTLPSPVT